MGWYRRATVRIGLALYCLLGSGSVFAAVEVLSDAILTLDGTVTKGQKQLLGHPIVKELLASFGRAEAAVQREDLGALMAFYSPAYNYHGLKQIDVERIWDEVFSHYEGVTSAHLFSDISIVQVDSRLRAEMTCTGGLYATDEQTGKRVTLDSWFREVHYLVKERGGWRFLGNAGEAPGAAPFSSAPHHPLF